MAPSIDYEATAAAEVNNFKRFKDFGMANRESYEGYCIVYTQTRDSGLLAACNAERIDTILWVPAFVDNEDVREFSANHWACGWATGYAIRVYDSAGAITAAFMVWCDLQAAIADYLILDEARYEQRVDEAACALMEQEGWEDTDENWEKAREQVEFE